ncbi:MAG: GNAT family protein [Ginsengibacter sp.]|jgi:ribosomal-protein-alanine N-acetyltransferase
MADKFPVLHTARLDLIEISQEHLEDIFHLFRDSSVTKFYNVITLHKEEEAQKYIDWFRSRFAENTGIRWGVALKGQKNIIGTAGFNNWTVNHKANLGYDLQSNFWNKGYVTEALEAVINYGFQKLEINRVEAEVMPGNIASERVLAKLGFTNEGILRQWMHWNDQHYDMIMYSLLQADFMNR